MSRAKRDTNKGLQLAGMPLAIVYINGEWRPVIRAMHRFKDDPEVGVLGTMDDLKPPQRRKAQAWIDRLSTLARG